MIDHRNRNVFDCRRRNLRVADHSLSNANRRVWAVSGHQGVFAHSKTGVWQWEAMWRGVRIYGYGFATAEAAAKARAAAIRERFPDRAAAGC